MFKIIKRRTSRINYYYKNNEQNKSLYLRHLIFLLIFTAGLTAGSLVIRREYGNLLSELLSLYENYIGIKAGERPLINFSNSLLKSVFILITAYAAGLCAVGTPIIYSLPLINGIGIGTISAYMYRTFSLKGIGYCALTLYPGKIVNTVVMITACTFSAIMSSEMLKNLTVGEENPSFKQYNIRFLILLIFTIFASLIDTLLNSLFAGYFNFQ